MAAIRHQNQTTNLVKHKRHNHNVKAIIMSETLKWRAEVLAAVIGQIHH